MFNLRTEAARKREAAFQERQRAAFERRIFTRMRREFNRVSKELARVYISDDLTNFDAVIEKHRENVLNILTVQYRGAFRLFGGRVLDDGAKRFAPSKKTAESVFSEAMKTWIATVGVEKAVRISDTTRSQAAAALLATMNEGQEVTASEIQKRTGGVVGRTRARVIARTETHNAANAASLKAVDALELEEVQKEWISVEDSRTRASHAAADGQLVPVDSSFAVGAAMLSHPGDPTGPAGEVINCRCVMAYVTE